MLSPHILGIASNLSINQHHRKELAPGFFLCVGLAVYNVSPKKKFKNFILASVNPNSIQNGGR